MIRSATFLLALGIGFVAQAQLKVQVYDQGTLQAVPYAHVTWRSLPMGAAGTEVAGPDGTLTLPVDAGQVGSGLAIRIAFLGYQTRADTLFNLVDRKFGLQRSAMFALDDVVITGQYQPTTADRAVQRMHVIDAQRIQRLAAQNLADVLKQELNIRLSQDNILGTSMSMQGLGGQNVKILVDGVPVIGRQDGNLDLAQIDLSGIERVEVLEGPLSVSYGTNALAGTINLITQKNSVATSTLKATAYAEHLGRLNLSASAGQRLGKSNLRLTIGRNFFGGWNPGQSGLYDFSANLADTGRYQAWKPREQHFGRLNYRWKVSEGWTFNYKGELMQDRIIDRGMPRAPFMESAFDEEFLTQRLDNAVFAKGDLRHGRSIDVLVAHDRYRRTRNQWLRDLTTLQDREIPGAQDTSRFTLTNVRAVFASANDTARLSYELGADLNLETAAGDRMANTAGERMGDYAAFGSFQWKPTDGITLRPGVRYAYNTLYKAPVVPSVDLRVQLDTSFALRASYAQGFRAPSLKELFMYFVDINHDIQGNADLLAEKSNNYTAALSYRRLMKTGVLRGEVAAFHNRISNLITLAQVTDKLYSYINVGQYRTLGGSIGLGWESGHWSVGTGASITGRYDTLGVATHGRAYQYSPEASFNLTRDWRKQGWSVSLFGKYQGEQQNYVLTSDGSIGQGRIASFVMADASVTKRVWQRRVAISLGCKNLGNVTNLDASISNGGAHSGASTGSVPMAMGRTFFLRLILDLKSKINDTPE